MQDIPFGKFFDTKLDHELITNLVLVKSKELDNNYEAVVYLLKNQTTDDHYVVLEEEHGGDIEAALEELLGNHDWKIRELPPKNKDWYVTHHMAQVYFKTS